MKISLAPVYGADLAEFAGDLRQEAPAFSATETSPKRVKATMRPASAGCAARPHIVASVARRQSPCAERSPSPCASSVTARVLRLTPSRLARSARRRCSDFGARSCHFPL